MTPLKETNVKKGKAGFFSAGGTGARKRKPKNTEWTNPYGHNPANLGVLQVDEKRAERLRKNSAKRNWVVSLKKSKWGPRLASVRLGLPEGKDGIIDDVLDFLESGACARKIRDGAELEDQFNHLLDAMENYVPEGRISDAARAIAGRLAALDWPGTPTDLACAAQLSVDNLADFRARLRAYAREPETPRKGRDAERLLREFGNPESFAEWWLRYVVHPWVRSKDNFRGKLTSLAWRYDAPMVTHHGRQFFDHYAATPVMWDRMTAKLYGDGR